MWKTFRDVYLHVIIPGGLVIFGGIAIWHIASQGARLEPALAVAALFLLGCYRLWWRWLGPGRRSDHAA